MTNHDSRGGLAIRTGDTRNPPASHASGARGLQATRGSPGRCSVMARRGRWRAVTMSGGSNSAATAIATAVSRRSRSIIVPLAIEAAWTPPKDAEAARRRQARERRGGRRRTGRQALARWPEAASPPAPARLLPPRRRPPRPPSSVSRLRSSSPRCWQDAAARWRLGAGQPIRDRWRAPAVPARPHARGQALASVTEERTEAGHDVLQLRGAAIFRGRGLSCAPSPRRPSNLR